MASQTLENTDRTLPPVNGFAITTSDTATLTHVTRWIWVGGTGDITLTTLNGDIVLLKNVPVGLLPMCAQKVFATGTTATLLTGLY